VSHYLDYWGNKLPKCPHCKVDFEVWSGDHPLGLNYDDGGKTTFECEACRKEFVAVTSIEYTFSTAVSEEAADDDEWGPQEVLA
jgi:transposase-like zinc ribbon protein